MKSNYRCIALTGANGFLGSRLFAFLRTHAYTVVPISSHLYKRGAGVDMQYELANVFCQAQPDVLIHTAAISDTGCCENNPSDSFDSNVNFTSVCAQLCEQIGCKMIFTSSDQVYSALLAGEHSENTALSSNVYGRHKLEAEAAASRFCPDTVSLRLTWMYDLLSCGMKTHNNILLRIIRAAMANTPIKFSSTDFRGITYVYEVVKNIEAAFELDGGVYNFGSGSSHSAYDIACTIMNAIGLGGRCDELIIKDENSTPRDIRMDTAKAQAHGIYFSDSCEGILKCISDYTIGL